MGRPVTDSEPRTYRPGHTEVLIFLRHPLSLVVTLRGIAARRRAPMAMHAGRQEEFGGLQRRSDTGHKALCPVSRHDPGILMLVVVRAY